MFGVMIRNAAVWVVLLAGGFVGMATVRGDGIADDPTPEEILPQLKKSPEYTKATRDKKVVFCTLATRRASADDAVADQPRTLVEALLFNYTDGLTIRATYNPEKKTVLKVEKLEAYPTPLAVSEIENARTLAKAKCPRAGKLFSKYTEAELDIRPLAPVMAEKDNPRYGQRIVVLFIGPIEKLEETVSVTVNLTSETVLED